MAKKLYRSQHQKVIGGVCGGIAEYFELDPVLVRILLVVSVFAFGTGFLAYLIAMIIIPKRPLMYQEAQAMNTEFEQSQESENYQEFGQQNEEIDSGKTKKFFAYTLIVIGSIILLEDIIDILNFEYLIPSLLIIAGVFLLFNGKNKDERN